MSLLKIGRFEVGGGGGGKFRKCTHALFSLIIVRYKMRNTYSRLCDLGQVTAAVLLVSV